MKNFPRLHWTGRCLILFGLLVWLTGIPVTVAQAHANLVRSVPEIGALLAQAPKEVTLEFSEDLDPGFSQVRLVDAHSVVVVSGAGRIDSASRRILRLALPTLADGSYSAVWQVRSAADGHITYGSVGFSVGKVDPAVSLLPNPNQPTPTRTMPPLPDTLLRWLNYLALSIWGGGLTFGLLVWRPAYRRWVTPMRGNDEAEGRLLKMLTIFGASSLALFSILSVLYAAYYTSSGMQMSYGESLLELVRPRDGWYIWLRLALLGVSAWLVRRNAPPAKTLLWKQALPLVPLLGVIATFSLNGHDASLGSALPVVADMFHLAAVCAWFGGLLPLFLSLRRTHLPAAILVPAFSRVALVSVTTLAITGVYSAYLHVRTLDALLGTYYGLALIVKVGLFGVLLLLGALNLLIFSPQLKAGAADILRRLNGSIRVELLVGALLLTAVGFLAGASPAYQAVQAEQRLGYIDQYRQGGTTLKLWVAPGTAGDDEIAVDVAGAPASPSGQKAQVLLRFRMLDQDMGITQAKTTSLDDKRYTARGSYLSMAGTWQIDVIWRSPGVNDIRHPFTVTVRGNPNESTLPNPIPASPDSLAAGADLYQENCLPCHGESGKGDGPAGLALNPHPADLSVHAAPGAHTDGQLYLWISQGYSGSAMPPFDPALTDEQRWDLVNFIHTLAKMK